MLTLLRVVPRRNGRAGEIVVTIRQARKLARYWAVILGLDEWLERMEVIWGTKKEMRTTVGLCHWFTEENRSRIKLDREQTDEEMEKTIIHELGHLLFDGHKDPADVIGKNYDKFHERALNRFADTVYALDRLGKDGQ